MSKLVSKAAHRNAVSGTFSVKVTGDGVATVKASQVLGTKSVQDQLKAVTRIREQNSKSR